jgi:hypothetical protein
LISSDLGIFFVEFLLPVGFAQIGQLFLLKLLLEGVLFDVEVIPICLLHFFLGLALELRKLYSFVVAGDPVVLIGQDFPLMGGQLAPFSLVFEFVLELCDLGLLQFGNEVVALHGQV